MRKGLAILASLLLVSVGMLSQDVVIIRHPVVAVADPIAAYNFHAGTNGSNTGNWTWTLGFTTVQHRQLMGIIYWGVGGAQTIGYSNNATGGTDSFGTLTQQNNTYVSANSQVFCIADEKGGATTITFTNATVQYTRAAVIEFSNTTNSCTFAGSNQVMSTGDSTGSAANSVSSGNMTGTFAAGSVAVGLFIFYNASTFTAGTNYTLGGVGSDFPQIDYWVLGSQQTDIPATGNLNINDYWHASGVVIAHK